MAEKWMRLSGPKLRDRVDLWVAKFDPAGVRVPPKVNDNRYVEVGETSPGMAGIWASCDAIDAAAFDKRLDAMAATVCENDPAHQRPASRRCVWGVGRAVRRSWLASVGAADCRVAGGAEGRGRMW